MRLIPTQLLLLVLFVQSTMGQDTLPRFAVAKANGKIIISWHNNYPKSQPDQHSTFQRQSKKLYDPAYRSGSNNS